MDQFEANFKLKGYVSRQYLRTVYGNGYTTTLPLEVFTQRNFVADFIRLKLDFIKTKKQKKSPFDPPFGGLLEVTYAFNLQLVGKPVVDFLFVIIELFRYLLRLRRYKRKSKSACLEGGGSL